jgi:hypothetical protein
MPDRKCSPPRQMPISRTQQQQLVLPLVVSLSGWWKVPGRQREPPARPVARVTGCRGDSPRDFRPDHVGTIATISSSALINLRSPVVSLQRSGPAESSSLRYYAACRISSVPLSSKSLDLCLRHVRNRAIRARTAGATLRATTATASVPSQIVWTGAWSAGGVVCGSTLAHEHFGDLLV